MTTLMRANTRPANTLPANSGQVQERPTGERQRMLGHLVRQMAADSKALGDPAQALAARVNPGGE